MQLRYSITFNGVHSCSGGCIYCLGTKNSKQRMCMTPDKEEDIIKLCKAVDEENYKTFKYDWSKLYELLDNDPRMKKAKREDTVGFDLWGGDPLTNFLCLKDTVKALKKWSKARNIKIHISTSTNGLPLLRKEIVKYLRKERIYLQLSHDGLGQEVRTNKINPLDFPATKQLIKEGLLTAINATLTSHNYSLWANINYFNKYLKEIFPKVYSTTEMADKKESEIFNRLYIKLNHIMDSDYEWSFSGRVLDDYINEWFQILTRDCKENLANYVEYKPYMKYIRDQFRRGGNLNGSGNMCRSYQVHARDYSDHLDTTGRYTPCNLCDADNNVENPENKLPDYCKGCKYEKSGECNMCGGLSHRSDKCEYFYRWNQFLEVARYMVGKKNDNKPQGCNLK